MCADSNFEFTTPLKATLNVNRRAYEFCIYITHSVSFSTPEQCEIAKYTIPAELLPSLRCKLAHKTGKQSNDLRLEVEE